jgi:hypothetical protein
MKLPADRIDALDFDDPIRVAARAEAEQAKAEPPLLKDLTPSQRSSIAWSNSNHPGQFAPDTARPHRGSIFDSDYPLPGQD